jgi:hypothetical protein
MAILKLNRQLHNNNNRVDDNFQPNQRQRKNLGFPWLTVCLIIIIVVIVAILVEFCPTIAPIVISLVLLNYFSWLFVAVYR